MEGTLGLDLASIGITDLDGDGRLDLVTRADTILGRSIRTFRATGPNLDFEVTGDYMTTISQRGFADLDADGDLDSIGTQIFGTLVHSSEAGAIRQSDSGIAGSGDYTPVLGALGPVLSTSSDDELRLVSGLGGSVAILVFGTQLVSMIDAPLVGLVQYVGDPILFPPLPLSGPAGAPGAGTLSLSLPNVPGLAGATFVLQAYVQDALAPAGFSATNALELTFGL